MCMSSRGCVRAAEMLREGQEERREEGRTLVTISPPFPVLSLRRRLALALLVDTFERMQRI